MFYKIMSAGVLVAFTLSLTAGDNKPSFSDREKAFNDLAKKNDKYLSMDDISSILNGKIKDGKKPAYGEKDGDYVVCYSVNEEKEYKVLVHPDQSMIGTTLKNDQEFKPSDKSGGFFGEHVMQVIDAFRTAKDDVTYTLGHKKTAHVLNIDSKNVCALVLDSGDKVDDLKKGDKVKFG